MRRVQEQKLHEHEEQKDEDRAAGTAKVLPVLPEASGAQRN
jgi:hypothetical protein